MTAATPESIGKLSADIWCDAFESVFQQRTIERIGELEYNDQVAAEVRRYMAELLQHQIRVERHDATVGAAPSTTLHPNYQALVSEAVTGQVERWKASQSQFSLSRPLAPIDLDRANPKNLDLDRCRLLNHNPAQYLGKPVAWPAPVSFNVSRFMKHVGLPELAPYTEVLRLTTDGKVQVKAASSLWFRLFGVSYDFRKAAPMEIYNTVRPQQINNPQFLQFLELLT